MLFNKEKSLLCGVLITTPLVSETYRYSLRYIYCISGPLLYPLRRNPGVQAQHRGGQEYHMLGRRISEGNLRLFDTFRILS
jgi:hypothetical protein